METSVVFVRSLPSNEQSRISSVFAVLSELFASQLSFSLVWPFSLEVAVPLPLDITLFLAGTFSRFCPGVHLLAGVGGNEVGLKKEAVVDGVGGYGASTPGGNVGDASFEGDVSGAGGERPPTALMAAKAAFMRAGRADARPGLACIVVDENTALLSPAKGSTGIFIGKLLSESSWAAFVAVFDSSAFIIEENRGEFAANLFVSIGNILSSPGGGMIGIAISRPGGARKAMLQ